MAVDVCSELSSPRISFSHDLKEVDFIPIESHHHSLLNPTIDFDFNTRHSFSHEIAISSADELFSNGKILPVEIKKNSNPRPTTNNNIHENTKKKRLIEFLSTSFDDETDEQKPIRPFWQFKRSGSVNSNGGLIGRSLQFLTRSNSTGSVPNPNPSRVSKVMQKQHSLKESSITRQSSNSSASSGFNQYYYYNSGNKNNLKKPFLRSGNSRSYGNGGIPVNPVLNIPPTYITKGGVSLFGIGSFFCNKKSKKKRK